MTLPFWPFLRPKTKLEILQESAGQLLSHSVAGVRGKLENLPLERVADNIKNTKENAAKTLGHAGENLLAAVSASAAQAQNAASHLAENVAQSPFVQGAGAKIESAKTRLLHTGGDVKEGVQSSAQNAALSARKSVVALTENLGESARETAEFTQSAGRSAQSKVAAVPKAVAQASESAQEKAEAARRHAVELAGVAAAAWGEWQKSVSEKARRQAEIEYSKAREAAGNAAGKAAEFAHERAAQTADSAKKISAASGDHVQSWRDALSSHFAQHGDEIADEARALQRRGAEKRDEIVAFDQAKMRDASLAFAQNKNEDATSKWLWIAVGALAGAALMLFLAPNNGRRSRALAQDKLSKASRKTAELRREAARKAADLRNKTEGKLHEMRNADGEDFADDVTVADRVRTALGEAAATRNFERINVDCVDGVVTLRGAMLDDELEKQIETIVGAVKGVREVRSKFLIDESGGEVFVG